MLLWGWERMFSSYSLWADASALQRTPSLREAVTFITVNPCLVFPNRGKIAGSPKLRAAALLRVGLGLVAVTLHLLVIALFSDRAQFVDLPALVSFDGYTRFTGYMGARALEIYCIHSGAASMTLGLFALLGYELPERYQYPFLASSPVDFWRRWNLYVADWFKHYVFNPTALRVMRSRPRDASAAKMLAVLLTFAACGAAHEYVLYLKAFSAGVGILLAFVLQGCVVLLWLGLERGFDTLQLRWNPWLERVGRIGARVVFYHVLFVTLWLAIPALSGWGLPPSLQRLISDWAQLPI
jgi:D-alanyl-lipoteichoic acid acyltransferase DltB (MBOAT superfamily)